MSTTIDAELPDSATIGPAQLVRQAARDPKVLTGSGVEDEDAKMRMDITPPET